MSFQPRNARRREAMMGWIDRAACSSPEYDTSWWYPGGAAEEATEPALDEDDVARYPSDSAEEMARKAKRVCIEECTVREHCLNYAIEYKEHHGIWGGWSARGRVRIRKRRAAGLPDPKPTIESSTGPRKKETA